MSNVAWIAMNNRVSEARAKLDPEVQQAMAASTQNAATDAAIAARLANDRTAAPPNIGPDGKPTAGRRRRKTRTRRHRRRGTRRFRR